MYKNQESYNIVKNIIINSIPYDITLKKRLNDEILIVMTNEFSLFFLNDIASQFLLKCDGKVSVNTILLDIHKDYDINFDVFEDDMIDLITDLQKKRIIKIKV